MAAPFDSESLVTVEETAKPAPDGAAPESASSRAQRTGQPRRVLRFFHDARDAALFTLASLAIIAALQWAQALIVPVVLGFITSSALEPLVRFLDRLRVPRWCAAALVVVGVTATLGWGTYALSGQAAIAVQRLPQAAHKVRELVSKHARTDGPVAQIKEAADELEKAADSTTAPRRPGVTRVEVVEPGLPIRDYLWSGSMGLLGLAGQLVLVLFLVFFLLASGDLYKRKLVKLTGPALSEKRLTVQMLDEMDRQVSHFLSHIALTGIVVGITTWLVFLWLGLEQAALWGATAGVLNVIPYVGPAISMAAAGAAALAQFGTIEMTLVTAGAAFAVTTLEGFLLTPWLISRSAQMNPVAVFIGLFFWSWLWGFWGMLLSVPILMVLKTVADRVAGLEPLGELLGE